VPESATQAVLDRRQLANITLDDEELMREIVAALIEDTVRQLPLLDEAIHAGDGPRAARLAHYSKGACANVGAQAAAAVLKNIEKKAAENRFDECSASLGVLVLEVDRLRTEAVSI